jgi:deazaflavin-dependent oxidoreductase (nitroreductase family)
MSEMEDFNRKVVDEFRGHAGKVGGPFEGAPVLLLHHRGAKTGQERVNPLVYQQLGDGWAIFASKGGSPTNPDWYHNLKAHPETVVEIGSDAIPVRVRELNGRERAEVWEKQKSLIPGFAEYEEKAGDRAIPVLLLERRD